MNRPAPDTTADHLCEAAGTQTDIFSSLDQQLRPPVHTLLEVTQQALAQADSKQQRRYLHRIRTASQQLLHRLNNQRDLLHLEQGTLQLQPHNFLLSSVLDELSQDIDTRLAQRPVTFRLEMDERIPAVLYGDSKRLRQLISCFTDNAIRFTQEGEIHLQVQVAARNQNRVRLHFRIENTGPRVPPELKMNLFRSHEAFSNTDHPAGTGLRLARLLARLMNGDAGFITPCPSGAAFWFSLQLLPARFTDHKPQDRATTLTNATTAPQPQTHVQPILHLDPDLDPDARRLLNDLYHALLQEDFNSLILTEQHAQTLKQLLGSDALRLRSALHDFDFRRARAILEASCSG